MVQRANMAWRHVRLPIYSAREVFKSKHDIDPYPAPCWTATQRVAICIKDKGEGIEKGIRDKPRPSVQR